MRGLRSLGVLAIVLAALGAYIYFVDSKREPASEAAEKKDKVFSVEADKISEVKITNDKGASSTLRRGTLPARSASSASAPDAEGGAGGPSGQRLR